MLVAFVSLGPRRNCPRGAQDDSKCIEQAMDASSMSLKPVQREWLFTIDFRLRVMPVIVVWLAILIIGRVDELVVFAELGVGCRDQGKESKCRQD